MKEIARIRNENNVEIMKLKKSLEDKLMHETGALPKHVAGAFDNVLRAKNNHAAFGQKNLFSDNEAERQRRMLTEENELLKKRLRALDSIMQSGNLER